MAQTQTLIQARTLTGSAASVTFANIPQNFTDLKVVISARGSRNNTGSQTVVLRFNSDSGANYSYRRLYADGTSAAADGSTGDSYGTAGYVSKAYGTANAFGSCEIYIPNYVGSTQKSHSSDGVEETNATLSYSSIVAGLWTGTSAINAITLYPSNDSFNWEQNSTFYLYGVGGTRATGGTITSDADYTYHTFTSTSTFTALEKIRNAEILLVAGGGGGGNTYGGGGGAGGITYTSGQTFFAGTSYSAIVGAGGTGSTSRSVKNSGSNSLFGTAVVAVGGGGGGSYNTKDGASGGSGGGAAGENGLGGAATSGQGNPGEDGNGGHGGGGGGFGRTGNRAGSSSIGDGGYATDLYSYWHSITSTGVLSDGAYFIAGGGSGGSNNDGYTLGKVSGGAGQGKYSNGDSATANTGSGGGGGGLTSGVDGNGGNGGSGLIIVRYPNT